MARAASAAERARRIIALLGQLTPGTRVAVADLAREVGTTAADLADDLETLAMCGVAPYDPGDLMPLMIEDGTVEVWGELPAVRGPVRLSTGEARALAAALQAAGVGADDTLTSRLLAAAASDSFDAEQLERTVRAASSAHEVSVFEVLAQGLEEHAVLRLEYVKAGSEETSSRDVDPVALFAERGAWYLTAWCHNAGDWRTFRIDRIRSVAVTGGRFDPSARSLGTPGSAFDLHGLPVATLLFSAGERFTEREWPGAAVAEERASGEFVVRVPYAGTDWIARRVVARLGAVEALEPAEVRSAVRGLAAESSS